jgi:hypothetical protein
MVATVCMPMAQAAELGSNGQTQASSTQSVVQVASPYADKICEIDKALLSASEQLSKKFSGPDVLRSHDYIIGGMTVDGDGNFSAPAAILIGAPYLMTGICPLMDAGRYAFKRHQKAKYFAEGQQQALVNLQKAIDQRHDMEQLYQTTMQNIHKLDPEVVRKSEATVKEVEQMHQDLTDIDPQLDAITELSKQPKSKGKLAQALQILVRDDKFKDQDYVSSTLSRSAHWSDSWWEYSKGCP